MRVPLATGNQPMLDPAAVRSYIDKHRTRRQSNKVLHGHPSPVFWQEESVPLSAIMTHRARAAAVRKRLNLYVGTPYCLPTTPDRCGFCLFPSEVYRNRQQLDEYLDYLRREGDLFRPYLEDADLASIYFGGGTSNLYKAEQYAVLMDIVRGVFDVPADIEITLEGIPQTFSLEKLDAMQACGINRISMGVQQLDDELIKASGRKQTAKQVFRTIEWCQKLRLPLSVDLIYGWPNQTTEHMLKDLEAVESAGVDHITNYELNVAGRTDFSRHRRAELPAPAQNLEMYRVGKQFLESRGFRQVTPYDFERERPADDLSSRYLYEELFRRPFRQDQEAPVGFDAWGWGFAGISFFFGTPASPGWAYINQVRVDDYFRDLDRGRFPVMRGFHYTDTDLRLHVLFQEMQGLAIDRTNHEALFGRDVLRDFRPIWETLEELDWVHVAPERIALVGDGIFYVPLVQNLMALERTEAMRHERSAAEYDGPVHGTLDSPVAAVAAP